MDAYSLIIYFMSGFRMDTASHMAWFLLSNILFQLTIFAFALFCLSVNSNFEMATTFGSVLYLPFTMTAGYIVATNQISHVLRWIQYISFIRLGYQTLVSIEFTDNHFDCPYALLAAPPALSKAASFQNKYAAWDSEKCGSWEGNKILRDQLDVPVKYYPGPIFLLMVHMFVYLFISWLILWSRPVNHTKAPTDKAPVSYMFTIVTSLFSFKKDKKKTGDPEGEKKSGDATSGAENIDSNSTRLGDTRVEIFGQGISSRDPLTIKVKRLSLLASVSRWRLEKQRSNIVPWMSLWSLRRQMETKQLLQGIDFTIPSGKFTAIMGGSGSGKTTLLNALSRRNPGNLKASGDIYFNSVRNPTLFHINAVCSYVRQGDNFLMTHLTVRETLCYTAELSMGTTLSKHERYARVEEILDLMGLRDCADVMIGSPERSGISGGQRRRVSIAIQLAVEPACLFLDEPTTGLDAVTAMSVVQTLRKVASFGRTVVCTIHQPRNDIWKEFENVVLLLSGGRVGYAGKTDGIAQHFMKAGGHVVPELVNPPDFFVDTASINFRTPELEASSRATVDALAAEYERLIESRERVELDGQDEVIAQALQSSGSKSDVGDATAAVAAIIDSSSNRSQNDHEIVPHYAGLMRATPILVRRSFTNTFRQKGRYFNRITQPLSIGVVALIFVGRLDHSHNEVLDRLGLFQQLMNITLASLMANIDIFPREVLWLTFMAGFMISELPTVLFYLNYLSVFKYTTVVLALNEFTGLQFHCHESMHDEGTCALQNGAEVLQYLHIEGKSLGKNAGMVVATVVLYRLVAWMVLAQEQQSPMVQPMVQPHAQSQSDDSAVLAPHPILGPHSPQTKTESRATRSKPPPLQHFIYTVKKTQGKPVIDHTNIDIDIGPGIDNDTATTTTRTSESSRPQSATTTRTRTDSAHDSELVAAAMIRSYDDTSNHSFVLQTLITEPDSPSPILPAWPQSQLNPDYLAPYHPALHKNLRNWSRGLLDQLRQKSESTPASTFTTTSPTTSTINNTNPPSIFQAALASSTLPGMIVAAAPSMQKDFSVSDFPLPPSRNQDYTLPNPDWTNPTATAAAAVTPTAGTAVLQQQPPSAMIHTSNSIETATTSASTIPSVVTPPAPVAYASEGDKIERHFLFQTHHRPLRGQHKVVSQQKGNARQEQLEQQQLQLQQDEQKESKSIFNSFPRRKSSSRYSKSSPRRMEAKDKDALSSSQSQGPSSRRSTRSTERFRRLIIFFQRLLRSLRRQRGYGSHSQPILHSQPPIQQELTPGTNLEAIEEEDGQQLQPQQAGLPQRETQTVPEPGTTFSSAVPSSSKLDYLQVDESDGYTSNTDDDKENEHDHPTERMAQYEGHGDNLAPQEATSLSLATAGTSGHNHRRFMDKLKDVPKMINIVDRIKQHSRHDKVHERHGQGNNLAIKATTNPELPRGEDVEKLAVAAVAAEQAPSENIETTTSSSASTSASTSASASLPLSSVSVTEHSPRTGPRYHPKLLELYTITGHTLGVGTFATVKEIKLKSTGKAFALKIILKKTIQGKGGMLDTEIAVLSKVRHPHCVSLLEMFETEDAVFLVTDLAEGGELFDQLLQKGYYTEADAARLVHEILLGVEYLHGLEIVHRDLKPENLLFADKGENARLMITDFGLSKVLTGQNDVLMTACGTPGYVAPEVLEQIGHGKPVDLWSIGVIAFTLLCGYTPFWGEDQPALFENIISGEYQYEELYWKDISGLAKSFIDALLIRPAEKRPTASQALTHPWFRAMLDQNMALPASPVDSVNLLPSVRKNFNATNVFKKAVRAVGLLRKIQATE
ncbi:Calcium/calmodulin-dependent protein kinase type 1D, partial [Podila humilis]